MIRLTNDFHRTEYEMDMDLPVLLSPEKVKIIRQVLCGIGGCKCGETELQTRGKQQVDIVPTGPFGVRLFSKEDGRP